MKMKYIILFCIVTLSCVYSIDFEINKIMDINKDASANIVGLYVNNKYICYDFHSIFIYNFDNLEKEILITENDFLILHVGYNSDNNSILYLYGDGHKTTSILYNIQENISTKLDILIADEENNEYYEASRGIYWLDAETIIFCGINYNTYNIDIIKYNIKTKEQVPILKDKEITIISFNREIRKFIYKKNIGESEYYIFNLDNLNNRKIDNKYSAFTLIDKDAFLGFYRENNEYKFDILKNETVIETVQDYEIFYPLYYDFENEQLIADYYLNNSKIISTGLFKINM